MRHIYKYILVFILSSISNNASAASAASAASDIEKTCKASSLKALSCAAECASVIIEHNFNPRKNIFIASDQVLMLLNFLANLPGANPLKPDLVKHGMLVDLEIFSKYRKYIASYINIKNSATFPCGIRTLPLPLMEALGITPSIDEGGVGGIRNTAASIFTEVCFKSVWDTPFKEETSEPFETTVGTKVIRYLTGTMTAGYKTDAIGEVISIPLKNGGEFVVFKPRSLWEPKKSLLERLFIGSKVKMFPQFFDLSILEGLERKRLYLKLPKVNIESNIDIKNILELQGFEGLKKEFLDNTLRVGKFGQKVILKTSLEGVEASAITLLTFVHSIAKPVSINSPYYIAIVVTLPDGTKMPLFMGYIGDPTLS